MQTPAVATLCSFWFLRYKRLAEDFLKFGIIVQLFNLNQLLLCLRVLLLKHFFGLLPGLLGSVLGAVLLQDFGAVSSVATVVTTFTVLLGALVDFFKASDWVFQAAGCSNLLLDDRRLITVQCHRSLWNILRAVTTIRHCRYLV